MNRIKISVLMSVFNGEQYIEETINSVLRQNFDGFEFIIIDDGSTDKTNEIIKSFNDSRIILIEHKINRGLPSSLNEGIYQAKGEYIARIDCGDLCKSERLTKQYDFFQKNEDYVAVGSSAIVIDRNGEEIYCKKSPLTWAQIKNVLPRTPFIHPSVMFKKDAAIKVGCYDEDLLGVEDVAFFNKMAQVGKLNNISEPLIYYRITPNSITNRTRMQEKIINSIVIKYLKGNFSDKDKLKLRLIIRKNRTHPKLDLYYLRIAKMHLSKNIDCKKARSLLLKALNYNLYNFSTMFFLLYSFLPTSIIKINYKIYRKLNEFINI